MGERAHMQPPWECVRLGEANGVLLNGVKNTARHKPSWYKPNSGYHCYHYCSRPIRGSTECILMVVSYMCQGVCLLGFVQPAYIAPGSPNYYCVWWGEAIMPIRLTSQTPSSEL